MIGRRLIGCWAARVGVPVCRCFGASAPLVAVAFAVAVMTLAANAAHARRAEEAPVVNTAGAKREFGIVPIAGGNTDYGLGGGFLTNVAGLDPAVAPYTWRLEAAAFVSFKAKDAEPSEWVNPYQDYYFLLTVPHFLNERLRLELRPSYTRETTQLYYGLGNASVAPPDEIPGRDFYGREHPTLSTRLRWDVVGDVFVELGAAYTENWFELDPQSTLATDMNAGAPAVRELLGTATRHGVLLAENALIYDTRDSEIAPEQGQYHQLKIRYSPALGGHLPYQYGQANATFRFYLPFTDRLGLADPGGGRLAVRRRAVLRAGALRGHVRVRRRQWRTRHPRPALLRTHQAVLERGAPIAPLRLHRVPQALRPGRRAVHRLRAALDRLRRAPRAGRGRASGSSTGWEAGCAFSRGRRS